MSYVLKAKGIKKAFGGVKALVNGELSCVGGKICGLLGANGSGKSTFSKVVAGLIAPDSGELWIDEKKVTLRNPADAKKLGIVMVHQQLSLIPDFTVWENINFGHEPITDKGYIDRVKGYELAMEIVQELCPGLPLDMKVGSMLPAEQQLVEIAKAVIQNPRILILDEPTASLDQSQVLRLFKVLQKLKAGGTCMIFISHRLWEVKEICDFVVVFRNGENVGTIDFAQEERSDTKIISLITGKENVKNSPKSKSTACSEAVMEIENVSYAERLYDLRFAVRKGEILGIGGLQGQGQDEMLLVLSGLLRLDTGEIKINGRTIQLNHPTDAIHEGIVLVPGDRQKEGLFMEHSIFQNMVQAMLTLPKQNWMLPIGKYRKQVAELISRLSIKTDSLDTGVKNLSGGNQQKVVVGKWIPHKPKVLLLSDPAKGVDVEAKKELYQVVLDLAANGAAVILFASDNEELITYCDRVLIMYEGKIVEQINNQSLDEEHLVAASLRAKIL
jgi:ribose transport system ATP-binding protein